MYQSHRPQTRLKFCLLGINLRTSVDRRNENMDYLRTTCVMRRYIPFIFSNTGTNEDGRLVWNMT